MADLNVKLILSALDKLSPVVARAAASVQKSLGDMKVPAAAAAAALGNLGSKLGTAALAVGAMAGGAALGVGAIVRTAAAAETYATTLETIEGSADKAKAALSWIDAFEAKTPYDIDQVTEAFVRLRAYGIDPTGGVMESLGNTASAMGKPLMQAVEAMADAMTGENERLKEFGIRASVAGDKVTYSWTQNGQEMQKTVAKTGVAIQGALQDIFDSRFGGAMEKQAGTWNGLYSSVVSQIVRFVRAIGDSGPFQMLKEQLSGVLTTLNEMSASGALQAIAADIGGLLTEGIRDLIAVARAGFGALRDIHDLFGSWQPLIIGVAAVMAGPLILAVGSVVAALIPLGALLLANPIGLFAVAAAAAAGLIINNWTEVKACFAGLFAWLQENIPVVAGALSLIGRAAGAVGGAVSGVFESMSARGKVGESPAAGRNGQDGNVSGQINVKIDAPPGTKVTKIESKGPVGLGVDVGMLMQ